MLWPRTMGETAYVPIQTASLPAAPHHSAVVRVTHWVFTLSFLGLVVSGVAILLAHPHFYWGETGGIGSPSLFDLPLPTVLTGQTGWGRSLHFLSAWVAVLTGLLYFVSGILTQHFRRRLLPTGLSWRFLRAGVLDHLRFRRPVESASYNLLQRLAYLAVVFLLFPLTIVTGFAMSPVITSVIPQVVTVFGGHQSARTIHFFLADLLFLFLLVHIAMVIRAGFSSRMRAMIAGRIAARQEPT